MSGFTVAKYLRLSSEDADLNKTEKLESNSISNQRNLLDWFISHTPDFSGAAVTEFCDDGWSGKNFERPVFQEMIAQVQQGKIQCIIVKDMSRLDVIILWLVIIFRVYSPFWVYGLLL